MNYTIKQMAKMFDVTEHTLRFYTDKGLLPCGRDGKNRRVFNEESVNWMQGIKCLKGCGASIEDIQEYCRLCLLEESEENLRARYEIILKQRAKAYKRMEEAKKWHTMKLSSMDWHQMTPIRKNGQLRIVPNTKKVVALIQIKTVHRLRRTWMHVWRCNYGIYL